MNGRFTPQVQETITRLGAKLPYEEAAEEVERLWGVSVTKSAVRDITMRHGRGCVELEQAEETDIMQRCPAVTETTERVAMSVDGSFIHLCSGEWREVKLLTIGLYEEQWHKQRKETHSTETSYFARMETAERFAQSAIVEWQLRGCENAETIVAVNDGATWIQPFVDYHAPDAVRILDFAHACGYLAQVGRTVHSEGSDDFKQWFGQARHRLLKKAPSETLNTLAFLQRQQANEAGEEAITTALNYLQRRENQIDYAHFRSCGYPIGSGTVESGHKVVIQRRMKQAGMRWHETSVNPMLALRGAICNRRWDDRWMATTSHLREKRLCQKLRHYLQPSAPPTPAITLAPVTVAESSATGAFDDKGSIPAEDHPWRKGIWPDPRFQSYP